MKKILFPSSLFFLFLFLSLSSCRPFKEPVVKEISKFSFQKGQATAFAFDFGVDIENPNPYRLTLLDVNLDLFLNERKVGGINAPFRQFLKKASVGTVNFRINADLKDIMGGLGDWLSAAFSKEKKMKFRLKGGIKARALTITKRIPIDYVKEMPFEF